VIISSPEQGPEHGRSWNVCRQPGPAACLTRTITGHKKADIVDQPDVLFPSSANCYNTFHGQRMYHIGVISDTHGLVRPEAIKALAGSDIILHAGDIGSPAVLQSLRSIAPVLAVRGNTDTDRWAGSLKEAETAELNGTLFYILHDIACLDLDPGTAGVRALISGHSHMPSISEKNGILYLNPGSAGPRRFKLPVTLARIAIRQGRFLAEIVHLA
jgi:putative phosphoesterase